MTFLELQQEVSRRLAEVSGRVFFSLADIKTAINDGYMELSDASEWCETFVDVDLLNDRPYYDLWTILGSSFLAIRPAFDRQTNKWVLVTTVRQFDSHDRRWERVTGEPQRSVFRGLRWLGYWPRVQSDTGGLIKQYHIVLPPALVEDSDVPGFPDTFHNAIIDFAMTDLWAQDAETAYALDAWTAYLGGEQALVSWVSERASDAMRLGFGPMTGLVSR